MNAETLPVLADLKDPQLPQRYEERYEAAKTAIARCDCVDDLKDLSSQAAAIQVLARQRDDSSLRLMALKIQARAERKIGEILKGAGNDQGGRPKQNQEGDLPVSRSSLADSAGLSEHRRKSATRIASVPQDEFDSAIESDHPPTITQLAERGIQRKPISSVNAPGAAIGKNTSQGGDPPASIAPRWAPLARFAQFCGQHEPAALARSSDVEDARALQQYAAQIDLWIERFRMNLAS